MRRFARVIKRGARSALGLANPSGRAKLASIIDWFEPDDIDSICELFFSTGGAPCTAWDAYRDAHMRLPGWFVHGLDPLGVDYMAQQHRLWRLVSGVGVDYQPELHEREHDWGDIDPIRFPGYFVRRDPAAISTAADHTLATGMTLKHCNLLAGDWALEYGAGFAHTALALSRLGVNVDTVDVSETFCRHVAAQAAYFGVPLTPFHGQFGLNPRPGHRYNTILFFESFHHCVDFARVVYQLREHLAAGGRIILAAEPVFKKEYAAVPYPWGLRLHSEVVAVVRRHRWFELGFSETFLFQLFRDAGFVGRRIDCEPSLFGRLYVFELDAR